MSTSARMHTSRICVMAVSPFEERKLFEFETFHVTSQNIIKSHFQLRIENDK